MTVAADATYLPMLPPVRLPVRESALTRQVPQSNSSHAHRIYRLPPRQLPDAVAYGPNGYTSVDQTNGQNVDIYA